MEKSKFLNASKEDNLQWKTTSKYLKQLLIGTYSKFKLKLRWQNKSFQIPHMKTTFYGRIPQNIKRGISQQILYGSISNSKLKRGLILLRESHRKSQRKS